MFVGTISSLLLIWT